METTTIDEKEIDNVFTCKSEYVKNLYLQDPRVNKRETIVLKTLKYENVPIDSETAAKNLMWDNAVRKEIFFKKYIDIYKCM